MEAADYIALENAYGALNHHPLPVVVATGEGVVTDVAGRRYLDFLSASALNFGHRNPRLLDAARRQLDRVTLTSRAIHSTELGPSARADRAARPGPGAAHEHRGREPSETALKTARVGATGSRGFPATRP